jgi:hypothetical protein
MHAVLLPEAFGLWLEACARWPPLNKPSQGYHSTTVGGINIRSTALGSPSKIQASKTPDSRYFLFSI